MKKRYAILFAMGLFLLPFLSPRALTHDELQSYNECGSSPFELAYANADGTLSLKSCYNSYQEAKTAMDNSTEAGSDNLVIIHFASPTRIVDAKYALLNLNTKGNSNAYLYPTESSTSYNNYINGYSAFYATDAAYLGYVSGNGRAKLKISGYTGYIDKFDSSSARQYDIVPLSWVKVSSYYKVTEQEIQHCLTQSVYGNMKNYCIAFGPKPSQLNVGTYYSYDGNYFYQNQKVMLNDYRNGNTNNAINANDPYYNFYLYNSFRTKTNYDGSDIDQYLSFLGYNAQNSKMYGYGAYFVDAQEKYGTNAAMMFAIGANESAFGTSALAKNKNNLFGLNAIDGSAYGSGSTYSSIEGCIYDFSYGWLSYKFLQPGDYQGRWNGSNFGNKSQGINVKYASDPYWGEKAAQYYYKLDAYYQFQDYNAFQLAVLNSDYSNTVYPKKGATMGSYNVSSKYYQFTKKNVPIVIVEEVQGDNVLGNTTWYKIMPDPVLDQDLEYIGSSTSNPRYEYIWDRYVYVPAAYFMKINVANQGEGPVDPTPDPEPEPTPEPTPDPTPNPPSDGIQPSTQNDLASITNIGNSLYYFNTFEMQENKLIISGFMAITGRDNAITSDIAHYLILHNNTTSEEYYYKLDRWTSGYPFEMTNSDESVAYNYQGGWFQGTLDLSTIKEGDYSVQIQMKNGDVKSIRNFNNLFGKDMTRKHTASSGRGYHFQMNYYDKTVPLELFIRNQGLISSVNPPTLDTMYNSFTQLNFDGTNLHIRGNSHNIGVDYGVGQNVVRSIILENVNTFKRYSYNVGSITNGDYTIDLRVSDGKDKTRAWYDASLNLASLPSGTYAIYVKTASDGHEDYGELNDIAYKTIDAETTINNHRAYVRRVDEKRFRIELVIE